MAKTDATLQVHIRGFKWLRSQKDVKSCPSCGGSWLCINRCFRRWRSRYFINCENCHYCGKTAFSLKGALKKWNRRTNDGNA